MKIECQSVLFTGIDASGREYGLIKFSEINHDQVLIPG